MLAGVTIFPGDYVYADRSAAVVIPAGDLDTVLQEAAQIEENDAKYIELIQKEDPAEILRQGSEER